MFCTVFPLFLPASVILSNQLVLGRPLPLFPSIMFHFIDDFFLFSVDGFNIPNFKSIFRSGRLRVICPFFSFSLSLNKRFFIQIGLLVQPELVLVWAARSQRRTHSIFFLGFLP